jgi:NADPH:quinone reductase-like Zn-dependent oxidoreductase
VVSRDQQGVFVKAVQYHRFGGPEVLEYVDVPDPEPMAGDVVIKVRATALNHLDVVQRNGWYALPGYQLPHISGMDLMGEVVAAGSAVSNVVVGDRVVVDPSLSEVRPDSALAGHGDLYGELGVIGGTLNGGYAQLCLAPASHVYRVPDEVSDLGAAVFPTCWLTAWHALIETGKLQAGETLLVHAAGSGVSVAAIQIAHWRGATVLATAGGAAKVEQALTMGVAAACDNRTEDVTGFAMGATAGAGVDMVFDHVGPALFAPSLFALKPRGRMVVAGNTTGDQATIGSLGHLFHMGISIIGSDPYRYHEFAEAWAVYCTLNPTPVVTAEFPLAEAAEAHRRMEAGNFFGKLVLRP